MSDAGEAGARYELTRLRAAEGRGFERHAISLPCRMTFTVHHLRGVESLFAVASNISRSGVLLVAQRAIGPVQYIAVELAPRAPPHPAVVRRNTGNTLGCEFLTPLTARQLTELLHGARERS